MVTAERSASESKHTAPNPNRANMRTLLCARAIAYSPKRFWKYSYPHPDLKAGENEGCCYSKSVWNNQFLSRQSFQGHEICDMNSGSTKIHLSQQSFWWDLSFFGTQESRKHWRKINSWISEKGYNISEKGTISQLLCSNLFTSRAGRGTQPTKR